MRKLRLRELKSLLQQAELMRLKFFRLYQHVFPYTHFAKIMQQRGVADLAKLLARKFYVAQSW